MTTSRRLQFDLDTATGERILRLAAKRSQPADTLAREAVTQYLEREEARLTMQEDGLLAWTEYQSNGLHLSEQEADDWLAKLENGEDVDPPTCHG